MLGLGFRVVSGDVGAVNGVRVTYKVNGAETYKDFHHAVTACVKPNPCDWPKGTDHEDDYEDVILRQFGLVPD